MDLHDLCEFLCTDECYELYPAMRTIIILMLENYLSNKESKQQLKEIEKTLKSK